MKKQFDSADIEFISLLDCVVNTSTVTGEEMPDGGEE